MFVFKFLSPCVCDSYGFQGMDARVAKLESKAVDASKCVALEQQLSSMKAEQHAFRSHTQHTMGQMKTRMVDLAVGMKTTERALDEVSAGVSSAKLVAEDAKAVAEDAKAVAVDVKGAVEDAKTEARGARTAAQDASRLAVGALARAEETGGVAAGAAVQSESNAAELGEMKTELATAREEGNLSSASLAVLQAGVDALGAEVGKKASVGAVANLSSEVSRGWWVCGG